VDCISGVRAACLFKGATRVLCVVLLLHSANVRVNEVRLLSFLGDVEIGSSGEISQNLQNSKKRKQQKAFVCLDIRYALYSVSRECGSRRKGIMPMNVMP
jgi:hypothetical protein